MDNLLNLLLTIAESGLVHVADFVGARIAVQCLLIEQNQVERERISALLQSLGVACDEVEYPEVAIEDFGVREHGLFLVGVDSAQAAQELMLQMPAQRGGQASPKVIFYAAAPKPDVMAACILAGASDVLVQPFDRETLRFKLQQAGFLPH